MKPILINPPIFPKPRRLWRKRQSCRREVIPIDAPTPAGRRRLGYLVAVCRGEQIVKEICVVKKHRSISWRDARELALAIAEDNGSQNDTLEVINGDACILDLRDCEPCFSRAA